MTVMTVQEFQMVITLKITVAPVMLTAPMTVSRIVPVYGVVILTMMSVVFVTVIHPTTVYRIVQVFGVAQL